MKGIHRTMSYHGFAEKMTIWLLTTCYGWVSQASYCESHRLTMVSCTYAQGSPQSPRSHTHSQHSLLYSATSRLFFLCTVHCNYQCASWFWYKGVTNCTHLCVYKCKVYIRDCPGKMMVYGIVKGRDVVNITMTLGWLGINSVMIRTEGRIFTLQCE